MYRLSIPAATGIRVATTCFGSRSVAPWWCENACEEVLSQVLVQGEREKV
jgi:hypothetical protein